MGQRNPSSRVGSLNAPGDTLSIAPPSRLAEAELSKLLIDPFPVNSAPFYEKLLAVSPIEDLFVIEARKMGAITKRQEKTSHPVLVTKSTVELQ